MLRVIDALVMINSSEKKSLTQKRELYENVFNVADNILVDILVKESGWCCPLVNDSLESVGDPDCCAYFLSILERAFKKLHICPNKKEILQLLGNIKALSKLALHLIENGDPEHSSSVLKVWAFVIKIIELKCTDHHLVNDLCCVFVPAFKSSNSNVVVAAFCSWRALISAFGNIDPKCASLVFFDRLKLLLKPLCSSKTRELDKVADDVFDTWWHLLKTLTAKLPDLFQEVVLPFLLFCIGGKVRAVSTDTAIKDLEKIDIFCDEIKHLFFFSAIDDCKIPFFKHISSLWPRAFCLLENILSDNGEFSHIFISQTTTTMSLQYGIFVAQCIRVLCTNTLKQGGDARLKALATIPNFWLVLAKRFSAKLDGNDQNYYIKLFQLQFQQFCLENMSELDVCDKSIELMSSIENFLSKQYITSVSNSIQSIKKTHNFASSTLKFALPQQDEIISTDPVSSTPLRSPNKPINIQAFFKKANINEFSSPTSSNMKISHFFKKKEDLDTLLSSPVQSTPNFSTEKIHSLSKLSPAKLSEKSMISAVGMEESEESEESDLLDEKLYCKNLKKQQKKNKNNDMAKKGPKTGLNFVESPLIRLESKTENQILESTKTKFEVVSKTNKETVNKLKLSKTNFNSSKNKETKKVCNNMKEFKNKNSKINKINTDNIINEPLFENRRLTRFRVAEMSSSLNTSKLVASVSKFKKNTICNKLQTANLKTLAEDEVNDNVEKNNIVVIDKPLSDSLNTIKDDQKLSEVNMENMEVDEEISKPTAEFSFKPKSVQQDDLINVSNNNPSEKKNSTLFKQRGPKLKYSNVSGLNVSEGENVKKNLRPLRSSRARAEKAISRLNPKSKPRIKKRIATATNKVLNPVNPFDLLTVMPNIDVLLNNAGTNNIDVKKTTMKTKTRHTRQTAVKNKIELCNNQTASFCATGNLETAIKVTNAQTSKSLSTNTAVINEALSADLCNVEVSNLKTQVADYIAVESSIPKNLAIESEDCKQLAIAEIIEGKTKSISVDPKSLTINNRVQVLSEILKNSNILSEPNNVVLTGVKKVNETLEINKSSTKSYFLKLVLSDGDKNLLFNSLCNENLVNVNKVLVKNDNCTVAENLSVQRVDNHFLHNEHINTLSSQPSSTTIGQETPIWKSGQLNTSVSIKSPSILKKMNSPLVSGGSRHNRRVHFEASDLDQEEKCTTPKFKRRRKVSILTNVNAGNKTSPINVISPRNHHFIQSSASVANIGLTCNELIPLSSLENSHLSLFKNLSNSPLKPIQPFQTIPLPESKLSEAISKVPEPSKKKSQIYSRSMLLLNENAASVKEDDTQQSALVVADLQPDNELNRIHQHIDDAIDVFSVTPFMPECVNCEETMSMKMCQILAPSASTTLYQQLKMKNILTIGEFASLTEADIHQLHIKPPNRVERARDVLRKHYIKSSTSSLLSFSPLNASSIFQQKLSKSDRIKIVLLPESSITEGSVTTPKQSESNKKKFQQKPFDSQKSEIRADSISAIEIDKLERDFVVQINEKSNYICKDMDCNTKEETIFGNTTNYADSKNDSLIEVVEEERVQNIEKVWIGSSQGPELDENKIINKVNANPKYKRTVNVYETDTDVVTHSDRVSDKLSTSTENFSTLIRLLDKVDIKKFSPLQLAELGEKLALKLSDITLIWRKFV